MGLDRGRAATIAGACALVAFLATAGAVGFWSWRRRELRVEEFGADLANAIGGGMIDVEPDVPSLVPFWLLVGVAVVAVLVALVLGVTLAVTRPSATEP